ncbi:MAG: hypothetical protein GXY83_09730 [Rhodopirellula sp.]|nr:hypothetical protein [Rhodopirellula sp.]
MAKSNFQNTAAILSRDRHIHNQRPIDVAATDETYWRSFWYQPPPAAR